LRSEIATPRGCDYVVEDLRIALEVECRYSGYTRKRDLLREVVEKLKPHIDRGFHCFYVFANGYEGKDFLDVCSYLNGFGIIVIGLDPRSSVRDTGRVPVFTARDGRMEILRPARAPWQAAAARTVEDLHPPGHPTGEDLSSADSSPTDHIHIHGDHPIDLIDVLPAW
jgi:hypothetical protein